MHAIHQHRHIHILIGSIQERLNAFHELTKNFHTPIVTCSNPDDILSGSQENGRFTFYPFKKLPLLLGKTSDAILFDIEQGICANGLAIASGCIRGGGLFAIGLSDISTWMSTPDQELKKYLPWPLTPESEVSYFKHYLLQQLKIDTNHTMKITYLHNKTLFSPLPSIFEVNDHFQLTDQQQQSLTSTQKHLTQHEPAVVIMTAHRGRGKSTVQGILAAELETEGWRIAITAPRKEAVKTLKIHYEKYKTHQKALPFYAIDELIFSPLTIDCLIVDEAAAFPVSTLATLLTLYPRIVFSSTDHGYEIGGRGFGIRFLKQVKHSQVKLLECTLDKPVRWKENDPLERWVDNTLCLYQSPLITRKPLAEEPISTHLFIKGKEWLNNITLLKTAFGLLVSAHYQTSPSDLRWLLDDPSVITCIRFEASQIISIAVMTQEGPIDESLRQAILEGTRRPRGHLLPQSLLAHEGWLSAAEFKYWRVSRIATLSTHQGEGYASQLLTEIKRLATNQDIDILCTSFSAQPELIQFWQKNGFHIVRLGNAKDQSSGNYSIMMAKGLSLKAKTTIKKWHFDFQENFYITALLGTQDLTAELIISIFYSPYETMSESTYPYLERDGRDIRLFIEKHRPLSSIRPQLTRFIIQLIKTRCLNVTNPDHIYLCDLALGKISEHSHPYQSKKQFIEKVKKTLSAFLK